MYVLWNDKKIRYPHKSMCTRRKCHDTIYLSSCCNTHCKSSETKQNKKMQNDVNELITLGQHPAIMQYRDILTGLTGPGVKQAVVAGVEGAEGTKGAAGVEGVGGVKNFSVRFTNADQEHTTTLTYPKYVDLHAAIEHARVAVQTALTRCGIAEYRMSMSMDANQAIKDNIESLKTNLKRYQALLAYDRVCNGSQKEIAHESMRIDKANVQSKHSAAVKKAFAVTNDAARRPLLSEIVEARGQSIQRNADESSIATTVVVEALPEIRRETTARYETRERVQARNARIAKKLASQPKKKKA